MDIHFNFSIIVDFSSANCVKFSNALIRFTGRLKVTITNFCPNPIAMSGTPNRSDTKCLNLFVVNSFHGLSERSTRKSSKYTLNRHSRSGQNVILIELVFFVMFKTSLKTKNPHLVLKILSISEIHNRRY